MPDNLRKELQTLIARGRTREALDRLLDHTRDTDWHAQVVLLQSRWQSLQKESRLGLLSEAEKNQQRNRLHHDLLELINEVFAGDAGQPAPTPAPQGPEPPPNGKTDPTPSPLLPAAGGFALILLILGLIVFFPCPSQAQYTVFRIVLALAAGGCAALIPGIFQFDVQPGLKAGGALGVFALVYLLNPGQLTTGDQCNRPFDFTVFLEDARGQTALRDTGQLTLRLGNDKRTENINVKGGADFKQLPAAFAGDTVQVELQAEGWRFTNGQTTTPLPLTGNSAELPIERDDSRCCVTGSVRDEGNRFLPGVQVRIGDTMVETDSSGRFRLEIPRDEQRDEQVLSASKPGYQLFEARVTPASKQEVKIVLRKE